MFGNAAILLMVISIGHLLLSAQVISYDKSVESLYIVNGVQSDSLDSDNCTYKGIKLNGRIKFVNSFPDLKVQIVNAFPDLKVKIVSSFPDKCGEWEIVESFPDIKIQIVDAFPDLKIKIVEAFPGIP